MDKNYRINYYVVSIRGRVLMPAAQPAAAPAVTRNVTRNVTEVTPNEPAQAESGTLL